MQSRASRLSDVLTTREIKDLATADPSEYPDVLKGTNKAIEYESVGPVQSPKPVTAVRSSPGVPKQTEKLEGITKVAVIRNGKVEFVDSDFSEFAHTR